MKKDRRDYTTIAVSWEVRIVLDEIKKHLRIERMQSVDLNDVLEHLIKEAGWGN